jgi:hypothetical protein
MISMILIQLTIVPHEHYFPCQFKKIRTYHSHFIPEGVAEPSQIGLSEMPMIPLCGVAVVVGVSEESETPTSYQNYLATRDTADVTGGKPIAV